ncbi:CD109 antigen-like isoform X4 [Octopus vulgaris]|nr:CD109 antigen-like isoform X4 [Octopus vulgaris]
MVSVLQLGIFLTISICLVGSTKTINTTYYLLYAPRRFSIDDGLNITVVLFGKVEPTTEVAIKLKDGDKVLKEISQNVSADKKIAFFKMYTGDLNVGHYTLELNLGGSLKVFCDYGSTTTILTAKNIHKPGDTVKFRVLNLYRNLTARNSPAKVNIKDANENLLSRMQLTSENGVSVGEFPISSRPVLGTWTIEVEQDEETTKKTIEVKEYVLPKVEVTAESPKYVYRLNEDKLKDVILSVKVKALYTQGKPVTGTATLHITCLKKNSFSQKITKETTFKINLGEFASGTCHYFNINASVENDLDKNVYYADLTATSVTSFPIRIIQHYEENLYEPNVTSRFKVTVKRVDGQPLTDEDRKNPLKISINIEGFSYSKSSKIPEDGIVEFGFTPPNRDRLPVEVVYDGVDQSKKFQVKQEVILAHVTGYGSMSLIRKDDETTKPEFLVVFPAPVTDYFYTVVSRSKVFISKHVQQDAAKSATISFDTNEMFLKADLVVGYNEKYGELLSASASVDVKRPTSVSLNAKFKESPVEPGKEAELIIQSSPNTMAFVAAVDKSVLLLSKKTDSISEMVFNAIANKDTDYSFRRWSEVMELSRVGVASSTNFNTRGPIVFDQGFRRKEFTITGESVGSAPKPRTNFVETWIWDTVDTGSTGTASLAKTAPDTITTWVTTLFGMHPSEGFIPYNQEVELTTFKDFYISLGLSYSFIRGEEFDLNVYVFNYIPKEETVTVQLMNSDNTVKEEKTVKMAADQTEVAVTFKMEAKEIGKIPVLVQASIPGHSDAVQRYLNVIAEGSTFEMSRPLSVNVSSKESFTKVVNIEYPPDVVEGSEVVSVSVIGDMMGPILNGLDHLIRFPTGCGEQTMLSLYPNVLVYLYLEARSQLDTSTKRKLEKNTNGGYQNELRYQHNDGSFSAFGNSDKSGSTWLTAYVIKCFCKAKHQMKGVTIDSKVIENAVSWLLERQQKDGSFKEVGNVIHKDMQGGTSSGVTLTAFVAISLLQCQEATIIDVKDPLKKTAEYLRSWVNNKMAKDDYSRAVLLTAFAFLKDDEYFNMVNKGSFSVASKPGDSKSVELAAYILLAYSYKNIIEESIPVYNFLVRQRNSHGGFRSTQDTVMGLAALTQYALLFSQKKDSSVDVKIKTNEGTEYSFPTITYANSIMLYNKDLPSSTKSVEIGVTGNGFILVQVNWQYNLIPDDKAAVMAIKLKKKKSVPETAKYDACVKYTGKDDTGMVLVSINTLSGFTANLVDQSSNSLIKRSEVDDNKLVVYLDSLPSNKETCIPVQMDLENNVEKIKPQVAEVVMYYQPDQRADTTYSISDPITAGGNMLQSVCLVITLLSTALFNLLI